MKNTLLTSLATRFPLLAVLLPTGAASLSLFAPEAPMVKALNGQQSTPAPIELVRVHTNLLPQPMTNSIRRACFVALLALASLFLSVDATSQEQPPVGIGGQYVLENEHGGPIEQGHVIKHRIVAIPGTFLWVSLVTRDGVDQPRSSAIYEMTSTGYKFKNAKGNTGTMTPDGNGNFKSVMTSGANIGKVSIFKRQ